MAKAELLKTYVTMKFIYFWNFFTPLPDRLQPPKIAAS
jgi:hypothetical protein